jgi:hypothetical protein
MSSNEPIINRGEKYINDLRVVNFGPKAICLEAGQCRDSTNTNDITISAQALINGATNGVNGLDTGVLAINNWYRVFAIGDSTGFQLSAGLISLADSPNLPANYDMYRLVGWIRTNSTNADFLGMFQYGIGSYREFYHEIGISVLSAGVATVFTDVDLSAAVPPIVNTVLFNYSIAVNSAGHIVDFNPGNVGFGDGIVKLQFAGTGTVQSALKIPARLVGSNPTIQYKTSDALTTVSLLTTGFNFYL